MPDTGIQGAARVLVYGVTGSGKTTLARELGAVTGLPWHSVDDLTWEPGWVEVDPAEQRRRVEDICAQPAWILDTAYSKWLDVPMRRLELIVALDYPRRVSLARLVRRTMARIVDRRPICNGNRETLRSAFSRQSIIAWHFRSFARKRRRIEGWATDPTAPRLVRLTTPRQTARWLAQLG